jgi:hypothetical protein
MLPRTLGSWSFLVTLLALQLMLFVMTSLNPAWGTEGGRGHPASASLLVRTRICPASLGIVTSRLGQEWVGTLATNFFLSFLQINCTVWLPDTTAVDIPPPGLTHCPAM